MILVTGGAGFIGSNIVAALEEKGHRDIVICDELGDSSKWRNLQKRELAGIIHPDDLFFWLEDRKDEVDAIIHMGAISSTTETDVDLIIETNLTLSLELWKWCAENGSRFIYASSGATYGDGTDGFKDDDTTEHLRKLKPLNAYGWSKSLFDLRIARMVEQGRHTPTQWAGLKFFNVYGPNEYHKAEQKSVLCQLFPHAEKNLAVKLFKSEHPDYANGEQLRDFVYVKDCCDVVIWLLENESVNGIFNVGSGKARTFKDLAIALFGAVGHKEARIDYIDMPVGLHKRYQYKTEAEVSKIAEAGYTKPFTSLEEGVKDYVTHYLSKEDAYR
jgi:ADP-L-glycero-D-manno-heptose 6-epimerase